ncbi:MAG TPA: GDP-mannose 4,6-dehydratase [Candidatus Thermoplasmatota archaeon]|nr:GDP-mannose 4,6-dehydratase [Candidatus Thermoplasmatota archaeon]
MRYFLTGAGGFIGRHLVPRLVARGNEVTVLLRKGTERPEGHLAGVKAVYGDLTDTAPLAIPPGTDVVLHLAAVSFVPQTLKDPMGAFQVNATGTLRLLEAARAASPMPRFVYVSTGHVYGPPQYVPIDEKHPLNPSSPYGSTKAAADLLVSSYRASYGLPTTIVRPFNIYGPGQDASFVIPKIVDQARKTGILTLGDTSIVRDFTYVDDFIDLLLALAEHPGAVGEVFNAGSGHGHSIQEVIQEVERAMGKPLTVKEDPSLFRPGELKRLVVDMTKARHHLGWTPKVTLREGIERLVKG